jgi:hypothetical protein
MEVDDGRLIDLLPRMAATYALRPEWDANSLCWFLGHAARKGDTGR